MGAQSARPNGVNIFWVNSELLSNGGSVLTAFQVNDRINFLVGKLRPVMTLSARHCAVSSLVERIFVRRGPSKMLWIAAGRISAFVRGFIAAFRPRSMYGLAYENMSIDGAAFDHYHAVPSGRLSIWPNQTICACVGYGAFIKKSSGLSLGNAASERVAVAQKSLIMGYAPATGFNGLVAILDSAYRLVSHGVSPHVRGQGRALLTQRFRPDFQYTIHRLFATVCGLLNRRRAERDICLRGL